MQSPVNTSHRSRGPRSPKETIYAFVVGIGTPRHRIEARAFHIPLRQANRIRCRVRSKLCWVRALPRAPRAFVARDFVQERTNFFQERNFSCLAFIRRTCAASEVGLRSIPVRTSRQTTWETRNDLENSEGCRSVGGHGNQHVRLRSAQVDSIKAICPAPAARPLFRAGQACAPP